MSLAPTLLTVPVAGLVPVDVDVANALVARWGHSLGPCRRPFHQEGWTFDVDGIPVAVAISASTVSEHVVGPDRHYHRGEIVELARLAAGERWATRPMLRLWREVAAPRWSEWPVSAAVSYSLSRRHQGDLYRWDGWELWQEHCGSSGGGQWSSKRVTTDEVHGKKRLWGWRYPTLVGS